MAAESIGSANANSAPQPGEYVKALVNILDDFVEEKAHLKETQAALLNILRDSTGEKQQMRSMQMAVMNALEDAQAEKLQLHATEAAILNILDDSYAEKESLQHIQKAVFNILDDLQGEKANLAERTIELTAANAELESFSYSVAHDLRAPLRQIAGFSKILVEECGPEISDDSRRYLKRIQDGAQHMGKLVDDLLSLAKVSRQTLARRPTPLNELIRSVIESLQPECSGREIRWEIDPLWTAHCDPALVAQVFVNLLSNAIKFSRVRAQAVIQVGQTGVNGQRAIFVRDNGAGFDMAYAAKLFGVFQRLHKVTEFEGTGIGLANVQRIVHKHGGRIWAEAAPDQGATFFLTLPDAPLPDAALPDAPLPDAPLPDPPSPNS
jgi:light-regulated signal transduction histidine kinase (bacteriophytochrome)